MQFERSDFFPLSPDSDRVIANLEAAYQQSHDLKLALRQLPASMYWHRVRGVDYLGVKPSAHSRGTTLGARSPQTQALLAQHRKAKAELQARLARGELLIRERAALYKALRLPTVPDSLGEPLRAFDLAGQLGRDKLVISEHAMGAYELFCGVRFPRAQRGGAQRAVAEDALELACRTEPCIDPAAHEPHQHLKPGVMRFVESEHLFRGRPVSFVVATTRRRSCPLYVPDPRWMALFKLWRASPATNSPSPTPASNEERQGKVLLAACRLFLQKSYPFDEAFLSELPSEFRRFV
jgi:hypothetical protein